jgi:hypothetical protein
LLERATESALDDRSECIDATTLERITAGLRVAAASVLRCNSENNQKLGVCGAQYRDGFSEIEARARRD